MTLFSPFPSCRMVAALMFLSAFALAAQAQSRVPTDAPAVQPEASRTEALPEKDEVALFLVFNFGMPTPGNPREGYFVPQLVVWKDGRVLYGKFNPTPERRFLDDKDNWTYAWGKIDPQKTEELVKLIRTDFGFGQNGGAISDYGPDASTWTLQGTVEGKIYKVTTWEQFRNTEVRHNSTVSGQVDGTWGEYKTADGKRVR